nr:L-rhamnose ABC transporter [Raoultella sp. NCTC 9187]
MSSGAINEITEERMVSMMVGRAITQTYPKVSCTPGETVLEVSNLCHPTEFANINFSLRKGEILGFYGLVGAGRTELMQALSGISHPSSGEMVLNGKAVRFRQPADAIQAGIVCVPEERQKQGGDRRPADRAEHQPAPARQAQPPRRAERRPRMAAGR